MKFTLSPDQAALSDSVRQFLERNAPLSEVRLACYGDVRRDLEYSQSLWSRLAKDLGLASLAIEEDLGGSGASLVDLAVVSEHMGRFLTPVPFVGTTLVSIVANRLGPGNDVRELRDAIVGGDAATITLDMSKSTLQVDSAGTVSGVLRHVTDGDRVPHVVAPALRGDDEILIVVATDDAESEGLHRLDRTRGGCDLRFDRAPFRFLDVLPGQHLRAAQETARILTAAELVGVAKATLDASVEYAKIRHTFGRPIGSYQGVKHRCTDMYLAYETAWSATYYAAWAQSAGAADPTAKSVAWISACDAAQFNTSSNVQIHGGIGFTWEHDAHLYLRRAESAVHTLGEPGHALEDLSSHLLTETTGSRS